jgi:hypothetical protein
VDEAEQASTSAESEAVPAKEVISQAPAKEIRDIAEEAEEAEEA